MSDTAAQTTAPADSGQGAPVETPAPEPVAPQGDAPAVVDPATGVQPETTDAPAQPDGGQGLIAPYLEGVDESHRDAVAAALERYRADSDAQITRKFERLNAFEQYAEDPTSLEAPVALYERLMEAPVETLQWVFDQFQTHAGIDLRAQLLEAATAAPEPEVPVEPTTTDDDAPLTRKEWERLEAERAAQAQQEQQRAQALTAVQGWLETAATKHGLTLGEGDDAVRHAVITSAVQLMPQLQQQHGDAAGQLAVDTAVEAFVNRFKSAAPAAPSTPEPTIADGGTPPAPAEPDLSDPAARKRFMLAQLTGSTTQE